MLEPSRRVKRGPACGAGVLRRHGLAQGDSRQLWGEEGEAAGGKCSREAQCGMRRASCPLSFGPERLEG